MKRVVIYLMVLLLFGGIFGIAIQDSVKEDVPVISSALQLFAPTVAYADSDGANKPPPPPPTD